MNVWVEESTGDVLFYLSRSGCFDENNTLLKLGRFRLHTSRKLDMSRMTQRLRLSEGYMVVGDGGLWITLWADVEKPVVHIEVESEKMRTDVEVSYESWRTHDRMMTKREAFQSSWKFAAPKGLTTHRDSIYTVQKKVFFMHRNPEHTMFDDVVEQQKMQGVKGQMYNPLARRTFGGILTGDDVKADIVHTHNSWTLCSAKPRQRHHFQITMATLQGSVGDWEAQLKDTEQHIDRQRDSKNSRLWWKQFWQRSYIEPIDNADDSKLSQLLRNYTLFRYMMGCNAKGDWPTKFNGGLFTFDPEYVKHEAEFHLTPDFRNWGGGVHTAQNQRLLYWPLLKSGDYDLMRSQLEFYQRCLRNAELRSEHYWGHPGACFTEQIENFGLPNPAEYGNKRPEGFDPGMERNAWLEYEWDTCLEFCMMALQANEYAGVDISRYENMILSCLTFFDEHYKYLAQQRGAKTLDDQGHLVIYPGSAAETFKMAYNPSSTIAGLKSVCEAWIAYQTRTNAAVDSSRYPLKPQELLQRLPDIPVRNGMILPAEVWARVQNVESPQLYPVFPWRCYGLGRDGLDVAIRTYQQDSLALKFRSHIGWKQDNIWAACLGLTEEAKRLTELKLADGPYRFPAFWGPGFDWSPDHNWGGAAMIGLQEMLLQEKPDGELIPFPAWPREWDVRFRLHATKGRIVEATMQGGVVKDLKVKTEQSSPLL